VIIKALKLFPGVQFINAFGQTETASTITMLSPEDHMISGTPEEMQIKTRRLSSIGKPLNDVEVMIVGSNGQQLPTGEIGEIVARGERMMTGYWEQDQATAQTKINGWIYTGDLAYQDSEGYIFLAGRSKDFIKRGGEMISPEEVEQFLMTHPLVEEAAIVGVPDDEWGEVVKAFIVKSSGSSLTESEIIDFCGGNLSSFKKPQHVTFLDVMPRNALGKTLKTELRMQ
jgi:acyl-CoA synthetase (AMP-forming)/AMP-acid ligase II